jgi:hypothetical protein
MALKVFADLVVDPGQVLAVSQPISQDYGASVLLRVFGENPQQIQISSAAAAELTKFMKENADTFTPRAYACIDVCRELTDDKLEELRRRKHPLVEVPEQEKPPICKLIDGELSPTFRDHVLLNPADVNAVIEYFDRSLRIVVRSNQFSDAVMYGNYWLVPSEHVPVGEAKFVGPGDVVDDRAAPATTANVPEKPAVLKRVDDAIAPVG